jgi:hypothetical protein
MLMESKTKKKGRGVERDKEIEQIGEPERRHHEKTELLNLYNNEWK